MRLPSFRDLSKEQDKIYSLPLDDNFLISGPPGTGKTVIALYRASMYKSGGKKPILLCLSKLLSNYSKDAAAELDISSEVSTYHRWVYITYRELVGEPPPSIKPYVYNWHEMTPKLFNALTERKINLLIDEGQDLPPAFYTAISLMSQNFSVFADENQRITESQSTIKEIKESASIREEYKLTRNYRNTVEIAKVASVFYCGLPTGKPELPNRHGPMPVMFNSIGIQPLIDYIIRFERNNASLEIGIFTKTKAAQSFILNLLRGKTKHTVESYVTGKDILPKFGKPGIKVINFSSAKGLEFDAVFIPQIDLLNISKLTIDQKMMFYVLTSRARDQLFLHYCGNGVPYPLNLISPELVESKTL